jgi:hypothetical protein
LVATSFGLEPTRAGEEPTNLAGDAFENALGRFDPTCSPATFATTEASNIVG